eukprot:g917.t1
MLAKYRAGDDMDLEAAAASSAPAGPAEPSEASDMPLKEQVAAIHRRVDEITVSYDEEDEKLVMEASGGKRKRLFPGGPTISFYDTTKEVRLNLISLLRTLEREDKTKKQALRTANAAFSRLQMMGAQQLPEASDAEGILGDSTAEQKRLDAANAERMRLLQSLIARLQAERERMGQPSGAASGGMGMSGAADEAAGGGGGVAGVAGETAAAGVEDADAAAAAGQAAADATKQLVAERDRAERLELQLKTQGAREAALDKEFGDAREEWSESILEYEAQISMLEKELAAAEAKLRMQEQASRNEGLDLMAAAQVSKRESADEAARMREIEELKTRVEELLAELDTARSTLKEKALEADDLASKLRKVEKELKTARQLAAAEAKQQAGALQAELAEKMAEKQAELDALREQMDQALAALRAEHEAYLANFRKEFESELAAEHKRQMEELQAQLDAEKEAAKAARKEAHDVRAKMREELQAAKDEVAELKTQLEAAQQAGGGPNEEADELRRQLAKLEEERERERAEAAELRSQLDEAKAEAERAKEAAAAAGEASAAAAAAAAAEAALEAARADADALRAEHEAALKALRDELEAAQASAAEERRRSVELEQQIEAEAQSRKQSVQSVQEMKDALEAERRASAQLESERASLEEQLAAANAALAAMGGESSEQLAELQRLLADARQRESALQAEVEKAKTLAAGGSAEAAALLEQAELEKKELRERLEAELESQREKMRADFEQEKAMLIEDQRKLLEERLRIEDEHEHDTLRLQQAAAENEAFRHQVAELQNLLYRVESQLEKINDAKIVAAVQGGRDGGDEAGTAEPDPEDQIPQLLTAVNANRRKSIVMMSEPQGDWIDKLGSGSDDGAATEEMVLRLKDGEEELQAKVTKEEAEERKLHAQLAQQQEALLSQRQAHAALEQQLLGSRREYKKLSSAMSELVAAQQLNQEQQQPKVAAVNERLAALRQVVDGIADSDGNKERLVVVMGELQMHCDTLNGSVAQAGDDLSAATAAATAAAQSQEPFEVAAPGPAVAPTDGSVTAAVSGADTSRGAVAQELANGGDSDVSSVSRRLATAHIDLQRAAEELAKAPEDSGLQQRHDALAADVTQLKAQLDAMGSGSGVSAAVLSEVDRTINFVNSGGEGESTGFTATSKRRMSILAKQKKILEDQVGSAGSWQQSLYLESGDVDLNLNLALWPPQEQLQILQEQKQYLSQKLDEQFQTLNAEKDKFRLLVMEGRQMLVDERHKTAEEQARAQDAEAQVQEEQQKVEKLQQELQRLGFSPTGDTMEQMVGERASALRLVTASSSFPSSIGALMAACLGTAKVDISLDGEGPGATAGRLSMELVEAAKELAGRAGEQEARVFNSSYNSELHAQSEGVLKNTLDAVDAVCTALCGKVAEQQQQMFAKAASGNEETQAALANSQAELQAALKAKADAEQQLERLREQARKGGGESIAQSKKWEELRQQLEAQLQGKVQEVRSLQEAQAEANRRAIVQDEEIRQQCELLKEQEEQLTSLQRQLQQAQQQLRLRVTSDASPMAGPAPTPAPDATPVVPAAELEARDATIATLEQQLRALNEQSAKYEAQIDALLEREGNLKEEKQALELEKGRLATKIKEIEEELAEKKLEPKMRVALENVKRGHTRNMQRIQTKIDSVRLQRERNFMNVVYGYSAVNQLKRVVFNGEQYRSIVHWAEETQRRQARAPSRATQQGLRKKLPALAGWSYNKRGLQPPLPPPGAPADRSQSLHTKVYAYDDDGGGGGGGGDDGSDGVPLSSTTWAGHVPESPGALFNGASGEVDHDGPRPSPVGGGSLFRGKALPVSVPPLRREGLPPRLGGSRLKGKGARAHHAQAQAAPRVLSGKGGRVPAVVLELGDPLRPFGAPAWRPKRLSTNVAPSDAQTFLV